MSVPRSRVRIARRTIAAHDLDHVARPSLDDARNQLDEPRVNDANPPLELDDDVPRVRVSLDRDRSAPRLALLGRSSRPTRPLFCPGARPPITLGRALFGRRGLLPTRARRSLARQTSGRTAVAIASIRSARLGQTPPRDGRDPNDGRRDGREVGREVRRSRVGRRDRGQPCEGLGSNLPATIQQGATPAKTAVGPSHFDFWSEARRLDPRTLERRPSPLCSALPRRVDARRSGLGSALGRCGERWRRFARRGVPTAPRCLLLRRDRRRAQSSRQNQGRAEHRSNASHHTGRSHMWVRSSNFLTTPGGSPHASKIVAQFPAFPRIQSVEGPAMPVASAGSATGAGAR